MTPLQTKLAHLGSEKPEKFIRKSANPKYVTVWCAISAQRLIGPYFFENSNEEKIVVNLIIRI